LQEAILLSQCRTIIKSWLYSVTISVTITQERKYMQRPKNLKKGDLFRVIVEDGYFNVDEIITLKQDDGSDCPYFWKEDKSNFWCISFSDLEPHTKTVRDVQVGDVVVSRDGYEHLVLERGQNTVLISFGNEFKKSKDNYTFDELEEYYTLKAEPVKQTLLTMDQIAEKFGIDVSSLKIAKE